MAPANSSSKGPREVTQIPAVVELFSLDGQNFILRLHDLTFQDAALKLAGQLPAAAKSMVIITPKATQLFRFAGTLPLDEAEAEGQRSTRQQADQNESLGPNGEPGGISMPESSGDPMEDAMRLADLATEEEGGQKRQPNKPQSGNRRRQRLPAPDNATCARCGGSGQVPALGSEGETITATCPICKGKGTMIKFGTRPKSAK